jgi:hypothetical protein
MEVMLGVRFFRWSRHTNFHVMENPNDILRYSR